LPAHADHPLGPIEQRLGIAPLVRNGHLLVSVKPDRG
jgi:hypothetical protein